MKNRRRSPGTKRTPRPFSPSDKPSASPPLWEGARVAETPAIPYGATHVRSIPAGEFKARCLELMDQVRDRHESIVVTKHGTPVAKLVPYEQEPPDIFGFMKGTVLWYGDIVSPIDVEWDALADE